MNADRSLASKGPRPVKQVVAKAARWVKANPLLAKAVPTAIGFCFGDLLTQYGQRKNKGAKWYDAKKTAQMAAVGAAVAGPVGLSVLMLPGAAPSLIGLKVVASEIVGCLIWQAAYININPEYRVAAMNLLRTAQASWGQQPSTSPGTPSPA